MECCKRQSTFQITCVMFIHGQINRRNDDDQQIIQLVMQSFEALFLVEVCGSGLRVTDIFIHTSDAACLGILVL